MTEPTIPNASSSPEPNSPPESPKSKQQGLLRSSSIVGMMTMVSRILGLARDIVIARYFGAGAGADAFFVAFKIPNFLRRLFAEGAFAQAFVPVLSEYRSKQSKQDVKYLVDAVAGVLGFVLLVVTLLSVLGSPLLTLVFAPGFYDEPEKFSMAAEMLRITFPYLFLISLTAFAGSILNAYGEFAVPAFTPVLLNLSLITTTLFFTPYFTHPVMALAWGVLLAGMLQLFFQFPFLMRLGLMPRPRIDYRHEGVVRIMKLMLPALFGVSVSQINLLLDTVLASFLPTGSISWLYYSDRLSELPLGVFGIAIATVVLPSLSRKHVDKDSNAFADTLDWAVRMVFLIGLPAAIALFVLAEPLIITLFYHGAMTDVDVVMSARSLRAYALGLLAFMVIKVLAPGYFARQDTKTPVKIGIKAMAANMFLNLVFIFPLAHAGLALATACSAWLNAFWLYSGLKKAGHYRASPTWKRFSLQLLLANVVMVVAIYLLSGSPVLWFEMPVLERILRLLMLVVAGLVSYFSVLWVLGLKLRGFMQKS